jgi:cytochrome c oxidase subunit III
MRVTPFHDHRSRFLAGRFGLRLFLVSLAMLFGASLVGFFVVRWQLGQRHLWPGDLPSLPWELALSTAILVLSSVSMQSALNSIRAGRADSLRHGLLLTFLLGSGFLLIQVRAWIMWLVPIAQRWDYSDEYRFALTSFFVLTGLHALHVVGGLIPMAVVTRNAFVGVYSREWHPGVQYVATYWHFLGVVWLVLLAAMLLGR